MKNDRFVWDDASIRRRNHLTHIDVDGGIYFVTYCQKDALTPGFFQELERVRESMYDDVRKRRGSIGIVDKRKIDRVIRAKLFAEMDRGLGRCDLSRPEIADLVVENLLYFDGSRYAIDSFSVMPNHLHVVMQPEPKRSWWKVTGSWKSYTSKEINRRLGRQGSFWQDDSWETLIRSESHLDRANRYVLDNPGRAGLEGWKWVGRGVGVARLAR